MVPRTVQMAKEISSIIGPYEQQLGNILGPQGFGWSNLFYRWFLDGPATLGNPVFILYMVHHWDSDKTPYFSQPPVRKQLSYGSCLHPVQDSPVPPPITNLAEGYI